MLQLLRPEAVFRCHLCRRFVADHNVQRGFGLRDGLLQNVAVAVIAFDDGRYAFRGGGVRDGVHHPENIPQNLFLFRCNRSHLLRVIRIRGNLHRIDRQHLRPDGSGAGHLQRVVGHGALDVVQLCLILLIDLLHHRPHGLVAAGILAGEEDAEARHRGGNQADDHNDDQRHPAACGDSGHQCLNRCGNGLGGGRDGFRSCFCSSGEGFGCRFCDLRRGAGRLDGGLRCRLRGFCRGLRRLNSRFGGLLGSFGAFLGCFDGALGRFHRGLPGGFRRLLYGALSDFGGLDRSAPGITDAGPILLRGIDGALGFPAGAVGAFGLAGQLARLVADLPGGIFRHVANLVLRIFGGADLAVIQQIFCLILGANEGTLHPLSGHCRLVQCLDAFEFLPGLDFRHQPTFFATTTKRPFL